MSLVSQYSRSVLLYRKNTDREIRGQSEIFRFPLRTDSGIHPAAVHQILITPSVVSADIDDIGVIILPDYRHGPENQVEIPVTGRGREFQIERLHFGIP